MRLQYVPRLVLGPDVVRKVTAGAVEEPADEIRLVDVDEDAATMAVEALSALLARAKLAPEQVGQVLLGGDAAEPSVAELVGHAVFGDASRVAWTGAPSETDGVVIEVHVRAVRPGSRTLDDGASAVAEARLAGSDAPPVRHAPEPAVALDADDYRRLVGAEARALAEVPMGAHTPAATWVRHNAARLGLLVGVCDEGHAAYPPAGRCATCGGPARPERGPDRLRVHTYTLIAPGGGPSEFDFLQDAWGAYPSLVMEAEDRPGLRIPGLGTVASAGHWRIGGPAAPVVRRLYATEGAWRHGVKFRPTASRGTQ